MVLDSEDEGSCFFCSLGGGGLRFDFLFFFFGTNIYIFFCIFGGGFSRFRGLVRREASGEMIDELMNCRTDIL